MSDSNNIAEYSRLVVEAQCGNSKSFDSLAELIRPRLYAYTYRIVLKDDIAQDIVQETLFDMFKLLDKLNEADKFWPWMRAIAFNKIRRHRKEKYQTAASISKLADGATDQDKSLEKQQGLAGLLGQELKQAIFNAMQQLKPHHRTVLTMRCYERMEYSEIAELTGRSELATRILFHRAKKSLRKQLSHRGLGKAFLLPALILFGKMTAPSEAAAAQMAVTAAALEVGVLTSLTNILAKITASRAAVLSLKSAAVTMTVAGAVTVGTKVPTLWVDQTAEWTRQGIIALQQTHGLSQDSYQCWYYYPNNTDAAVMMRAVKCDSQGSPLYCRQMQDNRANYFYDEDKNTIYIENHRMYNSDLSVWQLPTDKKELRDFISSLEGQTRKMGYIRSHKDGLLVVVNPQKDKGLVIHHYNVADEEYFQHDWPPVAAKVVDNRDKMHQRGWTYFSITGNIDGKEISGTGRIPFVHSAAEEHYPWLKIELEDGTKIIDGRNAAFKALARPWMGLHTVDTVRRDAAAQKMQFETRHIPGTKKAQVIVNPQLNNTRVQLKYDIDLDNDIIDKITFSISDSRGQAGTGELIFSYLQDIDGTDSEFSEPKGKKYPPAQQAEPPISWLLELMQESL